MIGCDSLDTMVPVLQGEKSVNEVIKKTSIPDLFLIPANTYLDGVERTSQIMRDPYSHERLRKSLKGLDFDYCFMMFQQLQKFSGTQIAQLGSYYEKRNFKDESLEGSG